MRRYATGRIEPLTADEIESMVRALDAGSLCPYTEGEANLIRVFVATLAAAKWAGRRPKPDGWHTYHVCGGLLRELTWSDSQALCVVCGQWFDAGAALGAPR